MATAKFIRAGRAHPSIPRRSERKPPTVPAVPAQLSRRGRAVPGTRATGQTDALREIRSKLEIAMAVVCISSAALRVQSADNDAVVALCLQRCAGDEIDRQIERIDALLEGGAS
jgi:hypothetical protein